MIAGTGAITKNHSCQGTWLWWPARLSFLPLFCLAGYSEKKKAWPGLATTRPCLTHSLIHSFVHLTYSLAHALSLTL